ncbi:hypothetical protein H2248_002251 [Termitomyces sp. 'cryptogamus']|nr:hypothetical protein H2248_002251 [Termitomyces sp. 'cryptogamus']
MHQFGIDFQGAMDWVINYHAEVEMNFLDGLKRVPSWGPKIDRQIKQYLYVLANWPRCNDSWNFESGRYFGSKRREIQKNASSSSPSESGASPGCCAAHR